MLIPGENDSDREIDEMTCLGYTNTLGPDIPLHFTAFHPDWKMMATSERYTGCYLNTGPGYWRMKNGLHFVYTLGMYMTA